MFSLDLVFQVLLMFDQRMYIQNKTLDHHISKANISLSEEEEGEGVF